MNAKAFTSKNLFCACTFAVLVTSICIFAFIFVYTCAPNCAYAKDYSVSKVDINANVCNDASLDVVEKRTFEFDGSFTCVWWEFKKLPQNSKLKVNGVSLKFQDENGGWQKLKSVPFDTYWRDAGGPGGFAYSFDKAKNAIYVFFEAQDTSMQVKLDITYKNAAQIYDDTAELYWQYVGPAWEVDSKDVNMTLTLPNTSGASFELGGDVRAWGHGNLYGSVSAASNNQIIYDTGTVKSGQFAEARVLFPRTWLNVASSTVLNAHKGETRINEVLSEEAQWADQANAQRTKARVFIFGFVALCVLVIIACVLIYWRKGKEYKPNFTDQYWRDEPYPNANPCVVGRVWRMNKEDNNDFMAQIMWLCDNGFINIGVEKQQKQRLLLGPKEIEMYFLERKNQLGEDALDNVNKRVMHILFDLIAGGQNKLYLDDISAYAQDNPEVFKAEIEAWQGFVEDETQKLQLFEDGSFGWQMITKCLAFIPLIIAIVIFWFTSLIFQIVCSVPTLIVCLLISRSVSKRSKLGADVYAKCKALKNWLQDFTALDERIPTDIKVWGKFMVYAYLFGIAQEVSRKLKGAMPQTFNDENFDTFDAGYVPWYWLWFYHPHTNVQTSFSDAFDTAFTNAFSTAFSNNSSGEGFGGGFSGGFSGGGGFGGGGGGAR